MFEELRAQIEAVAQMQATANARIEDAARHMAGTLRGVEDLLRRDRETLPTLQPSVLVLDDDRRAAQTVVRVLKLELPHCLKTLRHGDLSFRVSAETDVELARYRVKAEGVSVVVADYYLEGAGTSGAAFLRSLDRAHRGVLLSGAAAVEELRAISRSANARPFARPVTDGEWQAFVAHVASLLVTP